MLIAAIILIIHEQTYYDVIKYAKKLIMQKK